MMGFGSFGNGGGSSSSSNLSALAPPFTVDRSVPKPNSNPVVQFNEPPYAAPFNSSLHNSHSPTSVPNYFTNPNPEVDLMPSPNVHRYLASPSINSPNAHMPPLNPVATNAYSFAQYSDSVTTSLGEAKPYYPSYVSPAIHSNNPLVGRNEPGYDLLSTSCVESLNVSSRDDYTQSLSGLEYSSPWGGFWNGLADLESGRRTEFDGSFCSKETNVASSSICKDYIKQGAGASKGLSTCAEASAVPHSVNVPGREKNCIGFVSTKQTDDKSFLSQNFKFIPDEFSRTSILGSSSIFPETHPQTPFLESIKNSWNSQKPYSASYGKCFRQHDLCLNESVTKSSPSLIIRPPTVGASSSASNTVPFTSKNSTGSDAAGKSEVFSRNNPSNVKDPLLSPGFEGKEIRLDTSRLSIHLETNEHNVADISSTKKEIYSHKNFTKEGFDNLFKSRSEPEVPHISNTDGLSLALDVAEAINSVENSSRSLDQYNPAVDSPCWKGATAARFSPFEVSKAVTPQLLMKELEACNGSSLQGPQIFPLNTDDAVRVFSQKLSENIEYQENVCVENGLPPPAKRPSVASYSFNEHGSDDAVKAGSCSTKPSCGYGFQFFNDVHEPRREDALPNNSKSDADYKPSNITQRSLEELKFTSERKHPSGTCVADTGINLNDVSGDGLSHMPFHAMKHVLFPPSSGEDAPGNFARPHGGESIRKLDVQMLVKTMHNLSELLQFHCSNDVCALKEQDHETLKDVIKNLNACILTNAEQMTPTQESLFPQQGTSRFSGELTNLLKGASVDRPQAKKVAAADVLGQFDHQLVQKEKMHHILSSTKDEKFQNFVSTRDDADIVKNENVTQAIKKVLVENFHGEEETQPQVLMYKNLWLEAEAAICTINYRARFDRMKIEMEKCKSHEAKDVSENSMDIEELSKSKVCPPDVNTIDTLASEADDGIQDSHIIGTTRHADDVIARFHILKCRVENSKSMNTMDAEKPSSSKFSPALNKDDKLAPQAKDSPIPDISVQDSPISSKTSHVDDVNDSVMARFHILKCRVDNSRSMDMDEQQLPEVVDLGFIGKKNCSPIISDVSWDGSLDMTMEDDLQHHTPNCTEDKLTVKESRLSVRDDTVIQSCATDRLGNQLPAGYFDNSSSDWEHVLKDELGWSN
ncbi:hypothetical protein L1049_020602 [Liquidambar formosana]|uniref:Uncharacterized protein n=1 Tax=Liquidambar formosana TaxID=63359 RepID=A0AAP0X7F8_LIQFO